MFCDPCHTFIVISTGVIRQLAENEAEKSQALIYRKFFNPPTFRSLNEGEVKMISLSFSFYL